MNYLFAINRIEWWMFDLLLRENCLFLFLPLKEHKTFAYLVRLSEAVYPPHLALLVGVGEDAHGGLLARDGQHEVLATLLSYVLAQLAQQPASPLLLHLELLGDELLLAAPLLLQTHSLLVLFKVFPFCRLKIEPRIGERFDMGQKGFYKRMKLVLKET